MLVAGLLTMALGLGIAAVSGPVFSLMGFCLSAVMFFVVQSIIFLYPASRLKGVALAGGLGFVNACGLLGGFVGPSVMGAIEMSTGDAVNGLKVMALVLVVAAFACARDKSRCGRRLPLAGSSELCKNNANWRDNCGAPETIAGQARSYRGNGLYLCRSELARELFESNAHRCNDCGVLQAIAGKPTPTGEGGSDGRLV